ncbi:MAG: Rid family detoxifying hydrolase [Kiritimatiellae bacterium]|nr:Rid family detoxifying hydrolase [Kiritimatiellia bacterium]
MTAIHTNEAPAPIGPYSQGVVAGGWVWTAGQLGIEPCSGLLADGFIAQARQALANVRAVLAAGGAAPADVVKVTVFLKDLANFGAFNAVFEEFFRPPWPAREVIQAARLPRDAEIEISVVAHRSA